MFTSDLPAVARGGTPVVLAMLLMVACGDPPATQVFVGHLDQTEIDVAVLVEGEAIAVYQCGGPQTVATETRWYVGTLGTDEDPEAFDLEADGVHVTGKVTAEGIAAELVRETGARTPLRVVAVPEDGDAGVYLEDNLDRETSVIVQEANGDLLAQGGTCGIGACSQVIILAPIVIEGGQLGAQITDGTSNTLIDVVVKKTLLPPGGF